MSQTTSTLENLMGAVQQYHDEVDDSMAGRDPKRGIDSRLEDATETTVAYFLSTFLKRQEH